MIYASDWTEKATQYFLHCALSPRLTAEKYTGKQGHRIDFFFDEAEKAPYYTVGFELKATTADLNSPWGKNFECDYNFFVVPERIILQALIWTAKSEREDVGIICLDFERINPRLGLLKPSIHHRGSLSRMSFANDDIKISRDICGIMRLSA